MRISDWSSDVCSSDLLLARAPSRCRQGLGSECSCPVRPRHRADRGADGADADLREGAAPLDRRRADQGACAYHRRRAARKYPARAAQRSEEHTSELQSLMRISYAVFCLKKKNIRWKQHNKTQHLINTSSN